MLDFIKDNFKFIENEDKTILYCSLTNKLTDTQIKNLSYETFEKYLSFIGISEKPEKLRILCWISNKFNKNQILCVKVKLPIFELLEIFDITENKKITNEIKIKATKNQEIFKIKLKQNNIKIHNIYNEEIEKTVTIKDFIEDDIVIRENGEEYTLIAPDDGYIKITQNSIYFYKPLIVEHVNVETGNICYYHDIIVNGDVITGFHIRAGGDVIVKGVIEASSIVADGDITLEKPIMGMNKAKIISANNINLVSANKTHLMALKNINLKIELINCEVICSGDLIGSKNSRIVSGNIVVYGNIQIGTLGSKDIIRTKISAGIAPLHINKLIDTEQKIKKLKSRIDIIEKNKEYLIKQNKIKIPDYISTDLNKCAYLNNLIMDDNIQNKEIIKKIASFFFMLNNYKEDIQIKNNFFKNLKKSIINKKHINITVFNKIYQNTIINIKGYKIKTDQEINNKKLFLYKEEIKMEDILEA